MVVCLDNHQELILLKEKQSYVRYPSHCEKQSLPMLQKICPCTLHSHTLILNNSQWHSYGNWKWKGRVCISCSGPDRMKFKRISAFFLKYRHIQHNMIIITAGDHSSQGPPFIDRLLKLSFWEKHSSVWFLNSVLYNPWNPKDTDRVVSRLKLFGP